MVAPWSELDLRRKNRFGIGADKDSSYFLSDIAERANEIIPVQH
jgi:hypothetical protein